MNTLTLPSLMAYFLIYSVLGWMVEVAYQALSKGIISNRGFLCGPVCPIYGCGVVSILLLLDAVGAHSPEGVNAFGVFIIGVLLSTAIELFGGWALDKLFHMRWWDYRGCRFNLKGYICPQFALLWGGGILIVVRIVHPFIRGIVGLIPGGILTALILAVLYAAFLADIVVSVLIMVGLNRRFAELDEAKAKMRILSDRMSRKIASEALEGAEKAEKLMEKASEKREEVREEMRDNLDDLKENLEELRENISEKREELIESLREAEESFEERKKALYDKLIAHHIFGRGRVFFGNLSVTHRDYGRYIEELRRELQKRKSGKRK